MGVAKSVGQHLQDKCIDLLQQFTCIYTTDVMSYGGVISNHAYNISVEQRHSLNHSNKER